MKLSWRDIVTSLLVITGAAVVWAKFYEYSWALIGSWRSAVGVLGVLGIGMLLVTGFDTENRSWLNLGEMVLGLVAAGLVIAGVIVTSSWIFYSLASVLGLLWIVSTGRHIRHSIMHDDTTYHHHEPAH